MNYELQRAMREWEEEVDAEMVRLIEAGTPPMDAAGKARDIVSQRRSAKTQTAKRGGIAIVLDDECRRAILDGLRNA